MLPSVFLRCPREPVALKIWQHHLFTVSDPGSTTETDVRVRVRRSVVQVHGHCSCIRTIVPVATTLNGTSPEQSASLIPVCLLSRINFRE